MKYYLFINLEDTKETEQLIITLKDKGYNATVSYSKSLKHLTGESDEINFLSLHHLAEVNENESTTLHIVVDEKANEDITSIVKEITHNFTTTKGYVFSIKIDQFQGSF